MVLSNSPGARLYHSTASVWLSVDPLSDKYPNVSPYVYCAGNPVRLVDVDGREVWILANETEARIDAFNSLRSGTNLVLEMDDDGQISIVGGSICNDIDQQLSDAINSTSVICNIDANPDFCYSSGHYLGTKYDSETNTAVSTNGIYLPGLQQYEKWGAEGSGIIHEITEGYQMGLLSIENKSNINKASYHRESLPFISDPVKVYDDPLTNATFPIGHRRATPAPNEMTEEQAKNFRRWQPDKYHPTIHFPQFFQ